MQRIDTLAGPQLRGPTSRVRIDGAESEAKSFESAGGETPPVLDATPHRVYGFLDSEA